MPTPIERGTETDQVESIVRSLQARLGDRVDAAAIAAHVEIELSAYSTARITQFVPILVESHVRTRLCRQRSASSYRRTS
jgi:hypothetical protein